MKCIEKTNKGKQCKRKRLPDLEYCAQHADIRSLRLKDDWYDKEDFEKYPGEFD